MKNWEGGFLYRYRKWDEYTKKILTHGELYYAPFNSLNDPNEGKQISTDLVKHVLQHDAIRENDPEKFHSYIRDQLNKIEKNESYAKKYKQSVRSALDEMGIACFTARPDNNPMWHFYGDENKGICIEFYFPEAYSQDYKNLCPCPVNYGNDLELDSEHVAEILVFNKHSDWSYEQEYRLIARDLKDKNSRIIKYPVNKMLCSVIAGHNMPNDQYLELKKLIREVNKEFNTKVTVHRRVSKKFELTDLESRDKWEKRTRGLKFINAKILE